MNDYFIDVNIEHQSSICLNNPMIMGHHWLALLLRQVFVNSHVLLFWCHIPGSILGIDQSKVKIDQFSHICRYYPVVTKCCPNVLHHVYSLVWNQSYPKIWKVIFKVRKVQCGLLWFIWTNISETVYFFRDVISLLARVFILLIDTATQEVPIKNIWKKLSVQFLRYAIELLHVKRRTRHKWRYMTSDRHHIGHTDSEYE